MERGSWGRGPHLARSALLGGVEGYALHVRAAHQGGVEGKAHHVRLAPHPGVWGR